jgi:hypothetical protein
MHLSFVSKLFLVLVACFIVAFLVPSIQLASRDSLLTAATFLFSVLYGFEISIVINNFSSLKTQLAIENAGLLTIFHLADIIGGNEGDRIKNNVEKYLLTEPVKKLSSVKGDQRGQALQYMNEAIYYVPQARNQVAEFAPRFVDRSVWYMLGALAGILVALLFTGHDTGFLTTTTSAIFSAAVIGALILLEEIDSNRIQEAHLEYEIFNETLTQIGRERYYPDFAIKSGAVHPQGKYRIGHFPKYPLLIERTMELKK